MYYDNKKAGMNTDMADSLKNMVRKSGKFSTKSGKSELSHIQY